MTQQSPDSDGFIRLAKQEDEIHLFGFSSILEVLTLPVDCDNPSSQGETCGVSLRLSRDQCHTVDYWGVLPGNNITR